MKKVKLKSHKELKGMVRRKEIERIFTSDDGEITYYGTGGNPSHIISVWYDNYGKEYLVVDHPRPISKDVYEQRKVFFNEED